MRVDDERLGGFVSLGPNVEQSRPGHLTLADSGGGLRHAFRAEIGRISQNRCEKGWGATHHILGMQMRELVGKTGPAVHLAQEVSDINARQQMVERPFQLFGLGRHVGPQRRNDQFPVLQPHAVQLPRPPAARRPACHYAPGRQDA